MNKDELGSRLGAVCRLTGDFTLRSGVVSSSYFDKYLFEADPVLLEAVARHMVAMVPIRQRFSPDSSSEACPSRPHFR